MKTNPPITSQRSNANHWTLIHNSPSLCSLKMQDFIGSVRRSLVFKPSGDSEIGAGSAFGGFVEKIGSSIRKSSIGIFSKSQVPALPAISKAESLPVKADKKDDNTPIRWRKGEMIGCGAFGRVYMGMNVDSGELLAIKEVIFLLFQLISNIHYVFLHFFKKNISRDLWVLVIVFLILSVWFNSIAGFHCDEWCFKRASSSKRFWFSWLLQLFALVYDQFPYKINYFPSGVKWVWIVWWIYKNHINDSTWYRFSSNSSLLRAIWFLKNQDCLSCSYRL